MMLATSHAPCGHAQDEALPPPFWRLSRFVAAGAVSTLARVHVTGEENIPTRGRGIIASNHVSFLDPVLIVGFSSIHRDRVIHFLTASNYYRSRLAAFVLNHLHTIPVDRDNPSREIFDQSKAILQAEELVGIFPEGTRSPDGTLQPFKPGVGILARIARSPIFPVGIANAESVWPKNASKPSVGHTVGVHFGDPISEAEVNAFRLQGVKKSGGGVSADGRSVTEAEDPLTALLRERIIDATRIAWNTVRERR